jgi:hypothetical protein
MLLVVYFGIEKPISLVSSAHSGNSYNPGLPPYNSNYFRKIVARDEYSKITEGLDWTCTNIHNPANWQCGILQNLVQYIVVVLRLYLFATEVLMSRSLNLDISATLHQSGNPPKAQNRTPFF